MCSYQFAALGPDSEADLKVGPLRDGDEGVLQNLGTLNGPDEEVQIYQGRGHRVTAFRQ